MLGEFYLFDWFFSFFSLFLSWLYRFRFLAVQCVCGYILVYRCWYIYTCTTTNLIL